MSLFDKIIDQALKTPGDVAEKAAEVPYRLINVPLDVIEKTGEGMAKGVDKATDDRTRPSD